MSDYNCGIVKSRLITTVIFASLNAFALECHFI